MRLVTVRKARKTQRSHLADEITTKHSQLTGKRYCPHCNRWKPADEFKPRRNGKHPRCKSCVAKRQKPRTVG